MMLSIYVRSKAGSYASLVYSVRILSSLRASDLTRA